jgi:hypothetical protein
MTSKWLAMLGFGPHPLYSLDANALIDAIRSYRPAVFPSMRELVDRMVRESRLLMCEEAADECKDSEVRGFIQGHPGLVVSFEHIYEYLARLQVEAPLHHIELVDPSKTTSEADPFVVALALRLEQRDLRDLRRRTDPQAKCVVVTHERPKGPGAKWAKIPNVCAFYGLDCADWQSFLMAEGYKG